MARQKRTFREWEMEMSKRLGDVRDATEAVIRIIWSAPLRQTVEEKLIAIDGLNALERQLTGELNRARRKHIERQKTMCQMCGERRAAWRTEKGLYLCTDCACRRHSICDHTPRCEYCDAPLYDLTKVQADDHTGALYCSPRCALKASGCEPMTADEEDGQ